MSAPDDETIDRDPRNAEMSEESAMPTEFVDTPQNEPGAQTPPSPAVAEGQRVDASPSDPGDQGPPSPVVAEGQDLDHAD